MNEVTSKFDENISINITSFHSFEAVALTTAEFAMKLVFNAISTGACIQRGRVFSNVMINLGVRLVFNLFFYLFVATTNFSIEP